MFKPLQLFPINAVKRQICSCTRYILGSNENAIKYERKYDTFDPLFCNVRIFDSAQYFKESSFLYLFSPQYMIFQIGKISEVASADIIHTKHLFS